MVTVGVVDLYLVFCYVGTDPMYIGEVVVEVKL